MTPEQKKAIQALNRLKNFKDTLTEEEYFTLLEFVFAPPSQTQYVPINPTYPTTPIEPWYRVQPYCTTLEDSSGKSATT